MTTTLILRAGLIGMAVAIAIRILILFWKKESLISFWKPLIKAGLSGFILGCLGYIISYQAGMLLAPILPNVWLLLIVIFIISLVFGCLLQLLIEKTLWRVVRVLT